MVLAQDLRKSVLRAAIQGLLTEQFENDSSVSELIEKIKDKKELLIKNKKINRDKPFSNIEKFKKYPFEIPANWRFERLGSLMINRDSERIPISSFDRKTRKKIYDYYGASGVIDKIDDYIFDKKLLLIGEDGANLLSRSSPIAFIADGKYWVNNHAHVLDVCCGLNMEYIELYINSINLSMYVTGTAQPKMNQTNMNSIWIAVPPIEEQQRIVDRVNELMERIDEYEKVEKELLVLEQKFPDDMKNALLQAAMQGKLTEQFDSDSSVDEMLDDVETIKKGNINVEFEEDFLREIPDNWRYVRLGDLLFIARGGSPRPIQAYLTEDTEGINWIKIGDTEINGKYICSTKEKIIKDGIKKSRFVKEGDFLLTNSMSFGRPYILKTDGCIHDGWLVLSDENKCFEQDYLYWLLSSPLVFIQFSGMAAGAVVKNLNIDKVKSTIIPLPPIEEQRRIVERLEQLLPLCETL